MSDPQRVSAILNHAVRAFPNQFTIRITRGNTGDIADDSSSFANTMMYYAEKISFGEPHKIEVEYNDAIRSHFIKNAQVVKTATIVFRETNTYKITSIFKNWMDSMYSSIENVFLPGNPGGKIVVTIDTGGEITLNEAYPISLKYPDYDWKDGEPIKVTVSFVFNSFSFSAPLS